MLRAVGPAADDPVQAAAALARTATGDYVLIEGPDGIRFAEEPVATVTATREGITLTAAPSLLPQGQRHWEGFDLARLPEVFGTVPVDGPNWYGWCGFAAALPSSARDGETLVHAATHRREIHLTTDSTTFLGLGPDDLVAATERFKQTEPEEPTGTAAPVDVLGGRGAYEATVKQALTRISGTALRKVIVSRRVDLPFRADVPRTYLAGRRVNTPARSFCLRTGELEAAGFPPETVVEVDSDGTVRIMPLAGTRALTGDAERDEALRRELLTDPKEVYEHAVSVQSALDDLSAVCPPGDVEVREFMAVKRRGSVQHLGSVVRGRLAAGRTPWDAFKSAFPAVTASGIPRDLSLRTIVELEASSRDLYSGAVFAQREDGGLDAALVLRSVYSAGGGSWIRAGAGIVPQSDPRREFVETCEKLASVSTSVVPA
ncbi:salicylate synthase [Myceligenerans indicum]|uniref:Salicylate synthase n=1 Tax=Myceligenerans indicum TaxID=2593663 RepID=A0ABS1LHB8_9MICO|nr:salicylate synthase [Myceligenerans indicum]MBL0885616.1 salicylate synthase [Myceligenerans indicum]